jgi:anti-sigma-K factor RskA
VLGALTQAEAHDFETHLGACARCRAEVVQLREGASALPLAVDRQQPPAELKSRLMATVSAEAELLRAAGAEADRPERPRRTIPLMRIAAPLLAGAALATAVVVVSDDAGERDRVRTVAASESIGSSTARVEIAGETARLIVENVSAPPRGSEYAVWLVRPGRAPALAGTIRDAPGGRAETAIAGDLDGVTQVLMTVERSPSPAAPTSSPVLVADLG